MKRLLLFILSIIALFSFQPAVAQEGEGVSPATFTGSPTLWAAIAIGVIAGVLTLYYAFQMRASRLGKILTLFGTGMLLVVAGFLSVVLPWAAEPTQKIVHDLMFIAGYILMLLGATYIRKLTA